ncbi:Na(+)/H(+) exchange regulatory cofactor NHE-RF1-like [Sycon ciliatum]|uniref:Na(+)/H(+) exchange regulatory cofactor NHE-RF1-like n=1 Tax=Sycon ciliatum TaxID=27933 RepID=UPI0020AD77D8|eukprot:scpid43938/ scgid35627/ Na(+)/H(+) exchange regulatory cofactor NHE-RF1; Ezrin-radixin-moesin-binding phosphoprotein 50; Regulatory cofactor of Na(+)/H(+) exchanger; Sodium-hydrogen exchanger regulatory factor 1; Solute carrier family 9 isoform A3 regulatory factor 1
MEEPVSPVSASPVSPMSPPPGIKRPRLITVRKPRDGGSFGFNLHGVKGKPGQVVKSVEANGAALIAGLYPGDRVIDVNSICVVGETHASVVGRIRDSGDLVTLLVVDESTYDFYNARGLVITEADAVPLPSMNGARSSDDSTSLSGSVHSSSTEGAPLSPPGDREPAPVPHTFKKTKVKKRDAAKVAETDWAAKKNFFDDL